MTGLVPNQWGQRLNPRGVLILMLVEFVVGSHLYSECFFPTVGTLVFPSP